MPLSRMTSDVHPRGFVPRLHHSPMTYLHLRAHCRRVSHNDTGTNMSVGTPVFKHSRLPVVNLTVHDPGMQHSCGRLWCRPRADVLLLRGRRSFASPREGI